MLPFKTSPGKKTQDSINAEDEIVLPKNERNFPNLGGCHLVPPIEETTHPSSDTRRSTSSKLMSVLRKLTNSASSTTSQPADAKTHDPTAINTCYFSPPPELPPTRKLSQRISLSFLKTQPTTQAQYQSQTLELGPPKPRSAVVLPEPAKNVNPPQLSASSGDTSRNTSLKSGKYSNLPTRTNSTGKTSLTSKNSGPGNVYSGQSQNSADKKPIVAMDPVPEESRGENPSTPKNNAAELYPPMPTVVTVEKAAAAKIFFELHYNDLFQSVVTPRSLRRRNFEGELHLNDVLSPLDKENKRIDFYRHESEYLRQLRTMRSRIRGSKASDEMAASFELVKVLGKGSFGVVRLVREKTATDPDGYSTKRRDVYAMKVIKKADMLRNSQEGHLRAERDFLVSSEGSRWVVPLFASFQDMNNLYLVMEYMPGGDFLGLLIRHNTLSDNVAKFYIAEMVLCIEEAHALRWIHRDVKPDNFLLTSAGHLKISDFGLAFDSHWSHDQMYYNNHRHSLLNKLGLKVEGDSIDKKEGSKITSYMADRQKYEKKTTSSSDGEGILNWRNRMGNRTLARSIVGTSQYMAPEVVRGESYDARCDWWSVAIILFECLYGHTPFLSEEGGRAATKQNIVNHKEKFAFPSIPPISKSCQDLIRRMIREAPDRLCSKRYRVNDLKSPYRDYAGHYVYPNDAEDIKAHKWFKNIDWENLYRTTPPIVPTITGLDDTHYFDEEDPISDFSTSCEDFDQTPPTEEEITAALCHFNREIQVIARSFIASPYDSVRMKKIDRDIESFVMNEEQKEYLRNFARAFGQKERKRPRDRLLRDKKVSGEVLDIRKRGAFLGYSYRRIRRSEGGRKERPTVLKGYGIWTRPKEELV